MDVFEPAKVVSLLPGRDLIGIKCSILEVAHVLEEQAVVVVHP